MIGAVLFPDYRDQFIVKCRLFEFSKIFLVRILPHQLKFCQFSLFADLKFALQRKIEVFLANKIQGPAVKFQERRHSNSRSICVPVLPANPKASL